MKTQDDHEPEESEAGEPDDLELRDEDAERVAGGKTPPAPRPQPIPYPN